MGKYLIIGITSLCICWIVYVGISIASSSEVISPETVFTASDSKLIVLHKNSTFEETVNQLTGFQSENNPTEKLAKAIVQHTERIQHFYFCFTQPKILLERSKPWTPELVDSYFQTLGIEATLYSSKSVKLSNGWQAIFDGDFLLISKNELKKSPISGAHWKYIDRKASYTNISWNKKTPLIENCYINGGELISYFSQNNEQENELIDDQDIFQDIIPRNFSSYTFYETHYLRKKIGASLLFEWIDKGLVQLEIEGESCLITDQLTGQDPLAILGEKVDESSLNEQKTSGKIGGLSIPLKGFSTTKIWFMEVFNNRVFIAEDKGTIDRIIGSYETGETLTQDLKRRSILFAKSPRNVSQRSITTTEHRTKSQLKGSVSSTAFLLPQTAVKAEKSPQQIVEKYPIRVAGGIAEILVKQKSNVAIILSKSNTISCLIGNKISWEKQLEQKPTQALTWNYEQDGLFVATSTELHQLDANGNELSGFPIAINSTIVAPVVGFFWKNESQFAVATEKGIQVFSKTGNSKNKVRFAFKTLSQLQIWVQKGELMASCYSDQKITTFSIDRKKKRGELTANFSLAKLFKLNGEVVVIGIENNSLICKNTAGKELFAQRNNISKLLDFQLTDNGFFAMLSKGNNLLIINEEGTVISQFKSTFNSIEAGSIQKNAFGETIIVLLDGLANNNYIYGLNGKTVAENSFEGSQFSVLQQTATRKLRLLTQSNGYLVVYPLK